MCSIETTSKTLQLPQAMSARWLSSLGERPGEFTLRWVDNGELASEKDWHAAMGFRVSVWLLDTPPSQYCAVQQQGTQMPQEAPLFAGQVSNGTENGKYSGNRCNWKQLKAGKQRQYSNWWNPTPGTPLSRDRQYRPSDSDGSINGP